jgi:hypothetical protein
VLVGPIAAQKHGPKLALPVSVMLGAPCQAAAAASGLPNQRKPSPVAPTPVVLPSPFKEQPARQWNIPQEVVTGSKRGAAANGRKSGAAAVATAAETAAAVAGKEAGGRSRSSARSRGGAGSGSVTAG